MYYSKTRIMIIPAKDYAALEEKINMFISDFTRNHMNEIEDIKYTVGPDGVIAAYIIYTICYPDEEYQEWRIKNGKAEWK